MDELRALSTALLREPLRSTAADELHSLLAPPTLPDYDDGAALSPARAADCTRDLRRTAVFLRGLHDAIRSVQGDGGDIDVLYAGTGPLAPFALPLMAVLELAGTGVEHVRFTLVDIHRESTDHLRSLIARFGFERFVREIVTADATRYVPPVAPHVAVTETMRRSLEAEPQVAVTRQLARVLRPGGILVPERITVSLAVTDDVTEWLGGGPFPSLRHVATLLELTRERHDLPPVSVTIPEGVALFTTAIDVYGEHRLRNLDSGLTTPEILWNVRPGQTCEFRYVESASRLERQKAEGRGQK